MNLRIAAVWMILPIMIARFALAAEPALPDLESARMSLTWADFKALIEKFGVLKLPEAENKNKPPVEYALSRAHYDAAVVSETSVRVTAQFEMTVYKPEGWVSVPIIGNTIAPDSARLDDEETALTPNQANGFSVLLNKPGPHTCELTFFVASSTDKGVVSFMFPCVPVPLTHMIFKVSAPDAVFQSAQAINIATTRAEDHATAELTFRSTDTIEVSWSSPAILQQRVAPQEAPRVACSVSTLATITDRYLACESLLRYDVLRGGADTFKFRLPRDANVLNVAAEGAAWSSAETDAAHTIEVKVNHRIEDNYAIAVKYEAPLDPAATTVRVPAVEVIDIVRETGYVGVAARANVEVASDPAVEGLVRVDTSELPGALRALSPNPILLAFKCTDNGYVLAMNVRRLEDVPVRVASIDRASLVTVITDEGAAVTRASYDVRNNVKQFLRVDVPKDAEIWGAEVAGTLVKPARDGDSGAVLIPLSKSAEANRSLGTFPVELIYMQSVSKPPLFGGVLDLYTAPTDILINELQWEIWAPETERVCWAKGDLTPISSGGKSSSRRATESARVSGPTRRETIPRLRDGAAPAAPKAAAVTPVPPSPAPQPSAQDSTIAGVLPVRMNVPIEGIAHGFRRLIVPQGQPLALRLYLYHGRIALIGGALFQAASLAIGALAAYVLALALGKRHVRRLFVATALAGVMICVILKLAAALSLTPVLAGFMIALAAFYLVPWLRARVASLTAIPVTEKE